MTTPHVQVGSVWREKRNTACEVEITFVTRDDHVGFWYGTGTIEEIKPLESFLRAFEPVQAQRSEGEKT